MVLILRRNFGPTPLAFIVCDTVVQFEFDSIHLGIHDVTEILTYFEPLLCLCQVFGEIAKVCNQVL